MKTAILKKESLLKAIKSNEICIGYIETESPCSIHIYRHNVGWSNWPNVLYVM